MSSAASSSTPAISGNFPESASVDGAAVEGLPSAKRMTGGAIKWRPLLKKTALQGDRANPFPIKSKVGRVTHLRLNIFPDGGVARLRVHGEVVPDEFIFEPARKIDLAALANGGFVVSCSDMHYGNRQNLILPGYSTHMGDGWETKRRRGPGHDWAIVRLARRGVIDRIELDTDHFKGNAPGRCMLEYTDAGAGDDLRRAKWRVLLPESPLKPDERHHWTRLKAKPATHVRLNIYPDGGVARLRLLGRVAV